MSDILDRLSTALAGRYAIERELGAGGMATVYLAEDVRHHRKVAIKVFKEELGASVGAARFLREIEIAAQLQHPNILPLLDSGEAGTLLYYVMPYVEGQSLRERLTRERELPVDEAVRVLVEVVDALAHAHAHGVVHRDIKPDNVMLAGRHALVADFGVAKAVSEASEQSGITSMGVALGTPVYMSPEQAVADPQTDLRADLYAVGVLAYELLTGRPPFSGRTPQQVLAAHISEEPDPVSKHRPGVSPSLEHAIMRCLEKRPADRWQTADDLLAVLEPLATPSGGTAPSVARPRAPARKVPPWAYAAGGLALVGVALGTWWLTRPTTVPLVIGRSDQLTFDPGLEISPDISPDGKLVAYAAGTSAHMRIFIRPVGGGRTIPLSDDTTVVEFGPRWSPDGSKILFMVRGGVSVAPALGGASTPVIPPASATGVTPATEVASATWSPDGTQIAFARRDTLYRVASGGGAALVVGTGHDVHSCRWSPNGAWIACVRGNSGATRPSREFGNIAPSDIVLMPAGGGASITVVDGKAFNESPTWSADGRSLFFLSNADGPQDIYDQALSRSGVPRGDPVRLTTGLNAISFSLSADETRLAYAVYSARSNIWSLPIPSGAPVTIEGAKQVTTGSQVIESMSISWDGRWLVYDSNLHGNADIYRVPVDGGTPEQLTSEPWDEFAPELSPDGTRVAYHSFRTGTRDIEVKPLDGGPAEIVTATPAQESYPRWSPDGSALAYTNQAGDFGGYVVRRESGGTWSTPRDLAPISWPTWSPDGKWIAGKAREASLGLFIEPANGGDARALSDTLPDGIFFEWRTVFSKDGTHLYAKAHDAHGLTSLWSVPVDGGQPRLLVRFPDPSRQSARVDFTADGHDFYFAIEDRRSDVFVAEVTRR